MRGLLCVVCWGGADTTVKRSASVRGGLCWYRDYGQEVSERERRIMLVQPRMDLERNACGCSNSVLH